jgi:hypothetical protein
MGGNPNPKGSKPWDSVITLNMITPAKVEKLKPVMRVDATREKLWYGPFTLPEVSVSLHGRESVKKSHFVFACKRRTLDQVY